LIRIQVVLLFAALAAPALASSRSDAAIDALRNDSSLKVRTQAAVILGQRGSVEAIPFLREAVASDESPAVRIAAAGALARLHARVARPTLAAARESDPDEAVRSAASRALAALGPVTVHVEEPSGTAAVREAARASLANRLREAGVAVGDSGELRLRPRVAVETAGNQVSARISLVVVDGDGHMEMMEGSARATFGGAVPQSRLLAMSAKVVDAAIRGVCQDLATRLTRR
jgi:hypothetical protein